MKSAFAALFFLLSGIYFLTGAALCNPATASSAPQSDSAFVLSSEAGGLYAVAPIVNYSVPDKLRGKRRDVLGDSSLASAFVLCALTAVISAAFYKIFLSAAAHAQTRLSKSPNANIPLDAFRTHPFALLI